MGPTPTAPLLEDALHFVQTDKAVKPLDEQTGEGDPGFDCRAKAAILILDGQPSKPSLDSDGGISAAAAAALLAAGWKVYVVAFQLPVDTLPVAAAIASGGGTLEAVVVSDAGELKPAISAILDKIGAE